MKIRRTHNLRDYVAIFHSIVYNEQAMYCTDIFYPVTVMMKLLSLIPLKKTILRDNMSVLFF